MESSNIKKDLYEILGIDRNVTLAEIKKAYRRLAKDFHPDVNDGIQLEEWKQISIAYEVLKDSERREKYNHTGHIDNSVDNTHQQMMGLLADLFNRSMEQSLENGVDLFRLMRTEIHVNKDRILGELPDFQRKKEKLSKLYPNIKKHDEFDSQDFFTGLAINSLKKVESDIEERHRTLEMCERMLVMLEGYTHESESESIEEEVMSEIIGVLMDKKLRELAYKIRNETK